MAYILLIIGTILVNNIVFAQTLGICPFLGVSSKISSSVGMGAAVVFVITIATLITWLLNRYVLVPLNLGFLQTLSYILVIAALVQMVEIILKKTSPSLYAALGIFLPLITTNCAVLGVAISVVQKGYSLAGAVVYGFGTAVGFALALVIMAGIREQMELANIPKGMKGGPITLVTAGILALAFMGFANLVSVPVL